MWNEFQNLVGTPKYTFYCGDAAGRIGDFSDSDKEFAKNAGIPFITPEEIFPATQETFSASSMD